MMSRILTNFRYFQQRSSKALIFSLILHLVLFFVKWQSDDSSLSKLLENKQLVELSLVNPVNLNKIKKKMIPSKKRAKQIVNNELSGKEVVPKDSRFLGEKNQTFHRQTQASNVDRFKKASRGSRTGQLSKNKAKTKNKAKVKKPSLADLGLGKKFEAQKIEAAGSDEKLGLKNGDSKIEGLAANNDYLEDIPLGDVTNLNTKEFKFFGYYFRIRQKLEQHWGNSLRNQAERFFKSGRQIASDKSHITSLVITLNNIGEIVNVEIIGASGVRELDQAAVDSFNKAGPFPNPPKGMLNNNKQATIKWGFVVKT